MYDAGSVSARAELSLDQFTASLDAAIAGLGRYAAAAEAIPPVKLTVDASDVTTQVQAAQQAFATLQAQVGQQPPTVTPRVDLTPFEKDAALFEAAMAQIAEDVATLPPAQPHVDPTQAQAGAQQVGQFLQQLRTDVDQADKARAQPKLDESQVTQPAQRVTAVLSQLQQAFQGVTGKSISLDTGTAQQNAAALQSGLIKLESAVGVNAAAFAGLTAVLGASGFVAAGAAAAVALAQLGAEFKGFERTIANMTDATGAELAALKGEFYDLFGSIPADGGQIARAISIINQEFEQTGPAAERFIETLNRFTRVMGGELAQNTRGIVDVFLAWRVPLDDADEVLGRLTRALQRTGQTPAEVIPELKRMAGTLQEMGVSVVQATYLLDALSDAGVPARLVFGALREALAKAQDSGVDTSQFLRDVTTAIRQMDDEAAALDKTLAVFGPSGRLLFSAIRDGTIDLDKFAEKAKETSGALETPFAEGQTAAGRFQVALNNLKEAMKPLADATLEAAAALGKGFAVQLTEAAKALERFFQNPIVQKALELARSDAAKAAAQTLIATSPLGGPIALGLDIVQGGQDATRAADEAKAAKDAEAKAAEEAARALKKHEDAARDDARAAALLAAATQGTTKSLEDQLKAAQGNEALIQTLLAAAAQTETVDKAIRTLSDQTIAAHIQALRNASAATTDLTERNRLWDEAVALSEGHLEAQRATQEATTAAARQAEQEQRKLAETLERAGRVAEDEYSSRLQKLADTVLPTLDAATRHSLQAALILNDTQTASAIIAGQLGISQEQLAAILHGTGAAFEEAAKRAAVLAKGYDAVLTDETRARWEAGLSALSSGFSAADAARVKFLEGVGATEQALDEMLQRAGVAPESLGAFKAALLAGGAAAQDAQERLRALTTFARDQFGNLRLKIDIDIEAAVRKIHDLQEAFREAQADRARAESDALTAFAAASARLTEAETQSQTDHSARLAEFATAHQDAQDKLTESIRKAQDAADRAVDDVTQHRIEAQDKYLQTVQDAQAKLDQTLLDSLVQYQERRQDLDEKGRDAIKSAADGQAQALQSLSQAMTAFNQAQVQNAYQQSVALQNFQLRMQQGPGFDPNNWQNRQNEALIQFYQQQGAAALQQASQQTILGQAQKSAADKARESQDQLRKALEDNSKQLQKLSDQYQKQVGGALDQFGRTTTQAGTELDRAQTEAERKLDDIAHRLAEQVDQARREFDRQQQELARREAAEADRFARQLAEQQQQRATLEREFARAEADRQRQEARATRAYQKQVDQERHQLEALEALRGMPRAIAGALMGMHPEVNIGQVTMDEFGRVLMQEGVNFLQEQRAALGSVDRFR